MSFFHVERISSLELIMRALGDVKPAARGWRARCPAHESRSLTLSIAEGADGNVLLHCFRGCTFDAIANALGFSTGFLLGGQGVSVAQRPRTASASRSKRAARRAKSAPLWDCFPHSDDELWPLLFARAHDEISLRVGNDFDFLSFADRQRLGVSLPNSLRIAVEERARRDLRELACDR